MLIGSQFTAKESSSPRNVPRTVCTMTADGVNSSKAKRYLRFIKQWLVTITAAGTVH